jgi:hypothetical protein
MKKIVLSILVLFIAIGCARVKSTVSVNHILSQDQYQYKFGNEDDYFSKIKLLGVNENFLDQTKTLEHKNYEDLIEQEFLKNSKKISFQKSTGTPDVTIVFSYGIGSGKERSGIAPTYGVVGKNAYGTNIYGQTGVMAYSGMEYERFLKLIIFDAETTENIYETEVKSSGSSSQIQAVMPALIKSAFDGFPRGNHESYKDSQSCDC